MNANSDHKFPSNKTIVAEIRHMTGVPKSSVKAVLQAFVLYTTVKLCAGTPINLWSFGTFHIRHRKGRRNMHGTHPDSRFIRFKSSTVLQQQLNPKHKTKTP